MTHLDLSGSCGLRSLPGLHMLENLETLNLDHCKSLIFDFELVPNMYCISFTKSWRFFRLPELRVLSIQHCKLTSGWGLALALSNFKGLREMYFNHSAGNMRHEGMEFCIYLSSLSVREDTPTHVVCHKLEVLELEVSLLYWLNNNLQNTQLGKIFEWLFFGKPVWDKRSECANQKGTIKHEKALTVLDIRECRVFECTWRCVSSSHYPASIRRLLLPAPERFIEIFSCFPNLREFNLPRGFKDLQTPLAFRDHITYVGDIYI